MHLPSSVRAGPVGHCLLRVVSLLFIASLVVACAAKSSGSHSASTTITIIGTNDFHGALLPKDGYGGLPTFAGYLSNLRALRAGDGGAVLLVDAGDMWQGTLESNLSEGATVLQAYAALQYDAVAIGNHEFDYGPVGPRSTPGSDADDAQGALRARAAEASFQFLAANLLEVDTDRPVEWANVSASVIIEKAGDKLRSIVVLTDSSCVTSTSPKYWPVP